MAERLGLCWCGGEKKHFHDLPTNNDSEEYSWVQMADTQLGMMEAFKRVQWKRCFVAAATLGNLKFPPLLEDDDDDDDDDEGNDSTASPPLTSLTLKELTERELELAQLAVAALNRLDPPPAFAVVCGDLVHAFPDVDPEAYALQVAEFKRVFAKVKPEIPLICVCGNHDIGERPTPATLSGWRQEFGTDRFVFWVGGRDKYIVLNSQLYKDGSGALEESREQNEWFDAALNEEPPANSSSSAVKQYARHTIILSHIPPFISDPFEPSGYFPLEKGVRLDLLERAARGGATHWFAGHYHRNAGGRYVATACTSDSVASASLEVVTTAAVGGNLTTEEKGDPLGLTGIRGVTASENSSGLRLVTVCAGKNENEGSRSSESSISHKFLSLKDLACSTIPGVTEKP